MTAPVPVKNVLVFMTAAEVQIPSQGRKWRKYWGPGHGPRQRLARSVQSLTVPRRNDLVGVQAQALHGFGVRNAGRRQVLGALKAPDPLARRRVRRLRRGRETARDQPLANLVLGAGRQQRLRRGGHRNRVRVARGRGLARLPPDGRLGLLRARFGCSLFRSSRGRCRRRSSSCGRSRRRGRTRRTRNPPAPRHVFSLCFGVRRRAGPPAAPRPCRGRRLQLLDLALRLVGGLAAAGG